MSLVLVCMVRRFNGVLGFDCVYICVCTYIGVCVCMHACVCVCVVTSDVKVLAQSGQWAVTVTSKTLVCSKPSTSVQTQQLTLSIRPQRLGHQTCNNKQQFTTWKWRYWNINKVFRLSAVRLDKNSSTVTIKHCYNQTHKHISGMT